MRGFVSNLFGYTQEQSTRERQSSLTMNQSPIQQNPEILEERRGSKRKNIFKNSPYFYQRCIELEKRISHLKLVINYLTEQVLYFNSIERRGLPKLQAHPIQQKMNLAFAASPSEKESCSSSVNYTRNQHNSITKSFTAFNEILDSSGHLSNLKQRIFGEEFDLETTIKKSNYLELAQKVLDVSINSLLVVSSKQGSKQATLTKIKKEVHHAKHNSLADIFDSSSDSQTEKQSFVLDVDEDDMIDLNPPSNYLLDGAIKVRKNGRGQTRRKLAGHKFQDEYCEGLSETESSLSSMMRRHFRQK